MENPPNDQKGPVLLEVLQAPLELMQNGNFKLPTSQ